MNDWKQEESTAMVTVEDIVDGVQSLGIGMGDVVLCHSSLSKFGYVCGGAEALARALLEVIGEEGTLLFPTQTGDNSEPSYWSRPPVPESWWPEIRAKMPPYNKYTTPGRNMGRTAEVLRTWPGAVRSGHPADSFGAIGPRARWLCAGQTLEHPFGEKSPLARLIEAEGKILMLGTGYGNCTLFHISEETSRTVPYEKQGCAMTENGKRVWKEFTVPAYNSGDFPAIGEEWDKSELVAKTYIGNALCRAFPAEEGAFFATSWMVAHRPHVG